MKKKYEILNFNLKELDLLERHLNKMAQNHWHLKWISNYMICYEYNEEEIHYYIDYNQFSFYDMEKEDNRKEEENQINFYHELGYTFVCSFDHYAIYKSSTILQKIHTNDEIQKEVLEYVKKRTTKYHLTVLFGYAFFLFFSGFGFPKAFILSMFDSTWIVFILSLIILMYMTISNILMKRKNHLDQIKIRTLIHFSLHIIQCILLCIFPILIGMRFSSMILLSYYYLIYNVSNLFNFNTKNKKYKHVPFLIKFIPYLFFCFIVFFTISNYERDLDYYDAYNQNYPQDIIQTDFLMTSPEVYHYNEKDSILLHMIETRIEDNEANHILNVFYYNDKTGLLKPLILRYFTYIDNEGLKHLTNINDIEIKSVEVDELENDDQFSDLILINNQQYVKVRVTKSFNKDNIHQLINAINWK